MENLELDQNRVRTFIQEMGDASSIAEEVQEDKLEKMPVPE
jgi:hypothetical protein